MEKGLDEKIEKILSESERVEQLLKEPFKMYKFDPKKIKFLDHKGNGQDKIECDFCGKEKPRGSILIIPFFTDAPNLGFFSFFFCRERCKKGWIREAADNGNKFIVTHDRIDEIKEMTGIDPFEVKPDPEPI